MYQIPPSTNLMKLLIHLVFVHISTQWVLFELWMPVYMLLILGQYGCAISLLICILVEYKQFGSWSAGVLWERHSHSIMPNFLLRNRTVAILGGGGGGVGLQIKSYIGLFKSLRKSSTKSKYTTILHTGHRSAVGSVSGNRCESDCRSRGREFDPGPVPYFRGDLSWNNFHGHSPPFRWIIQEGLLSVTSESMCTKY